MSFRNLLKRMFPHIGALLFFYLLSSVYFLPHYSGKEIFKRDIVESHGASQEVDNYYLRTGEVSYWTNSLFGGMPIYTVAPNKRNDYFEVVGKELLQLYRDRPVGYFIAMMISFYLLMLGFRVRPLLAAAASAAFAFSTGYIIIYDVGHLAKLNVVSTFGLTTLGFHLAFSKRLWLGVATFGLGLALGLYHNHVQMVYYLVMVLAIYWALLGYHFFRESRFVLFLKITSLLAVAAGIAGVTSAKHMLPLREYTQDSVRGDVLLDHPPDHYAINRQTTSSGSNPQKKGLSWEYAMEYSQGLKDILSVLIPRAAGGATREHVKQNSKVYRQMRIQGENMGKRHPIPLYHGSLPHSGGTNYMGAVVLFLFVLGLFYLRGPVKWWLLSASLLTVVITMGHNMGFLNRIWYEFFPLFNKFRSHNMAINVTAFVVTFMGFYTLSEMLKLNKIDRKTYSYIWKAAGITAGICFIYGIVLPGFMDFSFPGDLETIGSPQGVELLISDRKTFLRLDGLRSIVFIGLAVAILYWYFKGKMSRTLMIGAFAVITIGDLWGVDFRYIFHEKFDDRGMAESTYFQARQVDQMIDLDTALHFRVHDMTISSDGSSVPSQHHKALGGYNAAKMRRYQDVTDAYLKFGHRPIVNMLNTKYFIAPNRQTPGSEQVILNSDALGNAWFVDTILYASTNDNEFAALADLEPGAQAVVHTEYSDYMGNFRVQKDSGRIELIEYAPNRLVYQSNTNTDQFAVFSEIWYGPDKGWKVAVDNVPSEHIRANYLLRAMIVPAGIHTIEFRFDPDSVRIGAELTEWSSLFLIILLLGSLAYTGFTDWKQWFSPLPAPLPSPELENIKIKSKKPLKRSTKGQVKMKKRKK